MENPDKRKIAFIVNPISGVQEKAHVLRCVAEKIDRAIYIPEIIHTAYAGHAVEIAARLAAERYFAVVAVGGDGTINEVARSLVDTPTALGIIPCGSGNGLARHLQVPMEAKRAVEVINEGATGFMDYGKINDTPFFCTCGIGFDAFVSLKFAEAGRRGPLTYLEKALLEILKYRPETYEVETDGSTSRYQAFLIACGNASQYGNNAYITPQATVTDGLLDVTILEPFTVLDAPSLAFQLFNKTIDQNSRIKTVRCRSLHIHRAKPGVVHFDGDPVMMGQDIEVNVIQNKLRVIMPDKVEKQPLNVLHLLQTVLNDLKQLNETIVGEIAQTNRKIAAKGNIIAAGGKKLAKGSKKPSKKETKN
ncbi:MAG: diacylglycerol kinase family lipid kinase [Prevotellaceae bacterium]|nr:diacylglycerol kinase family lipid kinase [Prevotellaceae bacterium]